MEEVKYIEGDMVTLDGRLKVIIRPEISDFRVRDIETNLITLCTIGSVEPIKLTRQILEANGWNKVHQEPVNCCNKYQSQKYRNVDLSYNMATKTFCFEFCFEIFNIVGAVIELPYVHDLQHLLFGLGLNSELKV